MRAQVEFKFKKTKATSGWVETYTLTEINVPDKGITILFKDRPPLVQKDTEGRWFAYFQMEVSSGKEKLDVLHNLKRHIWKILEYRYCNHRFKKGE